MKDWNDALKGAVANGDNLAKLHRSIVRANPSTWKLCMPTTTARYCLSLIL